MPVNAWSALQSEGHLIDAVGLANVFEISTHLRDEARKRQNTNAWVPLANVTGLGTVSGIHISEQASS